MKRLFIVIIFIIGLVIPLKSVSKGVYDYTLNIPVNNKYKKIKLESADTPVKRMIGLMYRKKLKKNTGMVFWFKKEQSVNFWMKNVNFPLDIIFLQGNKVVKIYKNAPPCKEEEINTEDGCKLYPSDEKISGAIELPAGSCDKYGIIEGQVLRLDRILN